MTRAVADPKAMATHLKAQAEKTMAAALGGPRPGFYLQLKFAASSMLPLPVYLATFG